MAIQEHGDADPGCFEAMMALIVEEDDGHTGGGRVEGSWWFCVNCLHSWCFVRATIQAAALLRVSLLGWTALALGYLTFHTADSADGIGLVE